MYLNKNNKNKLVIDIETDSLTPTVIWCCVILNKETRQVHKFTNDGSASIYHEIKRFIDEHPQAIYIGHNLLSFDIPVINRLCGTDINLDRCIDSLVLSYLYSPALDGGHSLESYGSRLGLPKIDFHDWSKFSEPMLEYCQRDVELTERVYDALVDRMLKIGFSEQSCQIEHNIRHIIDIQQSNGFWFNKPKAIELRDMLRQQETDKAVEIHKLFPPELVEVDIYQYRLKKDGSPFSSYLRHQQEYPVVKHNEDGTYSVYETREFNIGSPKQRVDRLLGLGWKPEVFTPKGFPKVDEDSLNNYAKESGHQAVAAMADWLVSNGRANMLDTWLGCVGEDSRIHGTVLSCGATTRRMRHFNPNTANIPSAAKARYGHECRALWGVTPDLDRVLVGYDAAGLETVGLLHYLNNPKATEVLLRPKPNDVHTANSRLLTEALGREVDREWGAKTSWYAWLYGAYPPKLGSIVKGDKEDGEKIIEVFFKNVPGLQELIEEVRYEFSSNHGLLRTIDGGYVRCPSLNAALNYRIQSMGAIVMKVAAILLHEKLIQIGLWHMKTGDIHDEGQHETDRKSADKLGKAAIQAIRDAGETLNLNVKTDGDYKVGTNWAETH